MKPQAPDALNVARKAAGMTQEDLWMRYFALGGMSQPVELEAIVHDALRTTVHDRDVVVHALNERFSELGRNHPVPYSADEPDAPPANRTPTGDRDRTAEGRSDAAHEREELLLDGLAHAHRRESGLLELEREITKAHRTGKPFVLAFIAVDGLKTVNDSRGHTAGDELLRQVVDTIRGVVREYDLIVRYGGDEFLCGLGGLHLPEAGRRFEAANASLAVTDQASISVGLAELEPDESLHDLIARADRVMYDERSAQPDE